MYMEFNVDEYAKQLSLGKKLDVWGLNFNAFGTQDCGDEFIKQYNEWRDFAVEKMKDCGCHIYPPQHIHITVGTPFLFKDTLDDHEKRTTLERLWKEKTEQYFKKNGSLKPFELFYEEMSIDKTAGIFLVKDDSGGVSKLREMLREIETEIRAEYDILPPMKIPNIVHSTFLRFVEQPSVSAEIVKERFEEIKKAFKPLKIRAKSFILIREIVPYQHDPELDKNTIMKIKYD